VEATTRRPRGDRTRAALVAAALDLFDRHGVDATAVDQITAAAQVAKGTFYVHFQRKEDVLLERAARFVGELGTAPATGPADRALHDLATRVAAAVAPVNRAIVGRMVRELIGHRDEWLRVLGGRPTLRGVLAPVVGRGQRDGELRTDLSAARLAHALTVLWLDTLIGWAEREEHRSLEAELDVITGLFLEGARARP
jgi:AcrR family transcriptional regulator